MKRIDLAEVAASEWDVVLVGSSFASMFFAHALPQNLDILIVEKGGFRPHEAQLRDGWRAGEDITQRNSSGFRKDWLSFIVFGGNSNFWWGDTPRFHPDDFRLHSRFGVGMDWPFGYDDLAPYYERAEYLMEIAGGGSDHILPRDKPFPYPEHTGSRADVVLQSHSNSWVPLPTARSNGGTRPTCCVNGVCGICPIDAKFTILNGLEQIAHPKARYVLDTEFREVVVEGGRATHGVLRGTDGQEVKVKGAVFALGANAIFNAAILLRSGVTSSALGRYLHEEPSQSVIVDTATLKNYFGGTSDTGHSYHFYHDIDRSEAAAVLIESSNAPPNIREEPGKWTNRLVLTLVAEDLPIAENRVLLEEDAPVIEWTGHHPYAYRGLQRALDGLPGVIPDELDSVTAGGFLPSQAHIQGTHRISTDPAEGVVDEYLRLHEVPNVFALGAGSFPTCSPANPTLTLSAMSLRAAEVVR
ncbi:GMC oxidoreductase [Ruegeria arenilitoris]|uniref:GMC oxidoreductase n=1 Tax=Ruegeria arenilitoris TaxID=1173585 RepID=UPI00147BD5BF|nr:GMC family oxidoreductase [Ruegeria arenilitoris]